MIKFGETVEIALQGTNLGGGGIDHPMHLHGFSFYIVGFGFGNYNVTKDPSTKYNLKDPPYRNTATVPRSGWVAIRFIANNPGYFSSSSFLAFVVMELPVVDLSRYLQSSNSESDPQLGTDLLDSCREVSRILKETGALLVKDPRCSAEDNDRFIDMMETYFSKPDEFKRLQERPNLHYQVGVTPEGVEVPRSLVDEEMQEKFKTMPNECKPHIPKGPDHKWRYMWRVGPRPSNTRFKELNSEPVIPEGFPEWKEVMDSWGYKMISAVEVVAEMAAIGFGLPKDAFTSLMKQ
ncbi:hypothetical protein F2Q70_00032083, partial [Brassica cretica]